MSTQNRAREGLRKKLHRVVDSVVSEWRLCLGAEDVQQNVPGLLRGKAACLADVYERDVEPRCIYESDGCGARKR